MKKHILAAAIILAVSSSAWAADPAPATSGFSFPEPIALPGYTWGSAQYPASVIKGIPEHNDGLFSGRTEQGADWFKFGERKEFTFNTFVGINYSVDTQGLPWNNYVKPQLGMQLRHDWANGGSGTLGVAYQWEDRWKNEYNGVSAPSHGNGVVVYYNFYTNWDLKKGR